ncbi:MAG: hypothetical protein HYS56_03660 [Candidatus Omnitrophica bacterium]|nr:hypothetical protein [Candidatus Omnitrophota bacterium]
MIALFVSTDSVWPSGAPDFYFRAGGEVLENEYFVSFNPAVENRSWHSLTLWKTSPTGEITHYEVMLNPENLTVIAVSVVDRNQLVSAGKPEIVGYPIIAIEGKDELREALKEIKSWLQRVSRISDKNLDFRALSMPEEGGSLFIEPMEVNARDIKQLLNDLIGVIADDPILNQKVEAKNKELVTWGGLKSAAPPVNRALGNRITPKRRAGEGETPLPPSDGKKNRR